MIFWSYVFIFFVKVNICILSNILSQSSHYQYSYWPLTTLFNKINSISYILSRLKTYSSTVLHLQHESANVPHHKINRAVEVSTEVNKCQLDQNQNKFRFNLSRCMVLGFNYVIMWRVKHENYYGMQLIRYTSACFYTQIQQIAYLLWIRTRELYKTTTT